MKDRISAAALTVVLLIAVAGLGGCRRDVKVTATPERRNQVIIPSVGGSPLATPATGLSPVGR